MPQPFFPITRHTCLRWDFISAGLVARTPRPPGSPGFTHNRSHGGLPYRYLTFRPSRESSPRIEQNLANIVFAVFTKLQKTVLDAFENVAHNIDVDLWRFHLVLNFSVQQNKK